jgi:hypothetical protein
MNRTYSVLEGGLNLEPDCLILHMFPPSCRQIPFRPLSTTELERSEKFEQHFPCTLYSISPYNNQTMWRGRGGGASFGSRHGYPDSDRYAPDFNNERQVIRPDPTSNAAWFIGLLSGNDPWLLQQVETKVFQDAREAIRKKTKLDIDCIVAACAAIHRGKTAIPDLGVCVLEYCKEQATSSIAIDKDDSVRYNGILRLAAEKSSGESTSWLTWRGQHDQLDKNGTMSSIPGKPTGFSGMMAHCSP